MRSWAWLFVEDRLIAKEKIMAAPSNRNLRNLLLSFTAVLRGAIRALYSFPLFGVNQAIEIALLGHLGCPFRKGYENDFETFRASGLTTDYSSRYLHFMARREKPPLPFCDLGFTLTEILVVVALISILTAIALPNWSTLLPTYALNGAVRQVQSELHRIKSQAVAENTSYQFNVSTAPTGSYDVQKSGTTQQTKPLPEGIEITEAVNISFSSRGTTDSDKTVKLRNSKPACKHLVVTITGRVSICTPSSCGGTC
jgi:prepilin-type N-terminal cleavage/methylation domain-containing protein